MTLLDKTEPSYLRYGAPYKSKSQILLLEAVMTRGRVGVNTRLKLGTVETVVSRVMSGVCGQLVAVDSLCFQGVQMNTLLWSFFVARILRLEGNERITFTSPGCMITCLTFRFGCFFASSQLNNDLSSLMKQCSSVGSSTVATTIQLGVIFQVPPVRHEKQTFWRKYSSVLWTTGPHWQEVHGQSRWFSQMYQQKQSLFQRHWFMTSCLAQLREWPLGWLLPTYCDILEGFYKLQAQSEIQRDSLFKVQRIQIITTMSERVTLVCRITPTLTNGTDCQYQLKKPKRQSTLPKDRKLCVFSGSNPRCQLVAACSKPISKGFLDDNLASDSDMRRLKGSVLKKADLFEFDRVINGRSNETTKRIFDSTLKKPSEQLFTGKSTSTVLMGNPLPQQLFTDQHSLPILLLHSLLSLLKLHKTHNPQHDYRLQVSQTIIIQNGVFDLCQEKTVTNFKKVNAPEKTVIQVRHEEECRALMHLAEGNLREFERRLGGKDKMHRVFRVALRRAGRVLGEIAIVRMGVLGRVQQGELEAIGQVIRGRRDDLEDFTENSLFTSLTNDRTITPNYLQLMFFVSSKSYENSLVTLHTAQRFANELGRQPLSQSILQQQVQDPQYLSDRQQPSGRSTKRPKSHSRIFSSKINQTTATDKTTGRSRQFLLSRNLQLEDKVNRMEERLSRLGSDSKEDGENKRLQFIEKEIDYRRKIKKYKDMVCKLEDMLSKANHGNDSVYKEQYEQIFEENIMLKEENEILQEKLRDKENISDSKNLLEKISLLERRLNKVNSEKTGLQRKIRTMQTQIDVLINEKEHDISKLARSKRSDLQ